MRRMKGKHWVLQSTRPGTDASRPHIQYDVMHHPGYASALKGRQHWSEEATNRPTPKMSCWRQRHEAAQGDVADDETWVPGFSMIIRTERTVHLAVAYRVVSRGLQRSRVMPNLKKRKFLKNLKVAWAPQVHGKKRKLEVEKENVAEKILTCSHNAKRIRSKSPELAETFPRTKWQGCSMGSQEI
ncbi:hypothetical protein JOM56_005170 [Amanita muscaria]